MRMTLMSLALVAAITAHAPAGASQQPRPAAQDRKVIIIIADTATWEEYTSRWAPFMGKWLRECAVGSMNTRVQGLPTAPAAYLTLGAGSRAAAELNPELAEFALNNDERYGDVPGRDLFHARTGERLPPGGVGYLGLPLVTRENGEAMYPLRLGLMGQALRRAGLKAAAIGNADVGDRCRRQVVTIVMDEAGIVPLGDVGPEMHTPPMFSQPTVVTEGVNSECWSRPQPDAGRRAMERQAPRLPNWTDTAEGGCAPYGYATPDQQNSLTPVTDYGALETALSQALTRASVVAVETGDLSRIAEQAELMAPAVVSSRRAEAMARMDEFIRRVAGRMKGHPWRLYLVTPTAMAGPEERADVLTPIAAWGEGVSRGLLTSPSTRRAGVVANVDLAPSVLEFLGIAIPAEAVGRPMNVAPAPGGDALWYVMRLQQQQTRLEANRPYVLDGASAIIVALFAITAMALLLAGPLSNAVTAGLREAGLLIIAFPLGALVVPADLVANPALVFVAVAVVVVAAYWAARALGRIAPPYAWLAGAFTLALSIDLIAGQRLVRNSCLGYSVTVGSRYYGLGNELGGVLLAAAPVGVAVWLGRMRPGRIQRLAAAAILAAIVIIIGHPAGGSNLGIAVPAALGFGLAALGLHSVRLRGRHLLIAGAAALVAVGIVLVVNWPSAGGQPSHIGLAIAAIQRGGLAEMAQILSRRMARNLVLVRHSAVTWILVSAVVVTACAALGRSRPLSEETRQRSAVSPGLVGAGVASALSFFLNDSGVAAAGWGFAVVAATLMYVTFDWRLRQGVMKVD